MPMSDSLMRVRGVLEAGLTTEQDSSEPWYIKTWYINDPIAFDYRELPFAIVKPSDERRVDTFVQSDTERDSISVWFFPVPINRARDMENEVNPAIETIAIADRAARLIRQDPTFGANVINAQVLGSTFRQPGHVEGGDIHVIEMRLEVMQRALWRFDDA